MAQRDYYESLEIPRTATADEIKRAHRKLVLKYHPDRNKNDKKAEEKFKEIQEAYDVLSDETKRRNYDQFGHAGVGGATAGGPGNGDPFEQFRRAQAGGGPRRSGWRASPGVTVEDFDFGNAEGGDFSSIFEQMFGGGGSAGGRGGRARSRSRAQPARGADVEHPVTLTFEQAARGTNLSLQIDRGGKMDTIEVKIPAGVKDGSRVRIRGQGEKPGGEPGDLYIVTTVLPHRYFRRDGLDVLLDLPLSVYEAMLGTKTTVPTLDGPVTLTVPPGTSSGAKLRIKGRGIERSGEKGDELVAVKVIVPKELDEEGRKLVQKLAEKFPVNARENARW